MSANNVMQHKFTTREIVLLIVLGVILFVGLYFLLVFYPVQNRIDELNSQKSDIQLENQVADVRLATYDRMKAALEEIEKNPEGKATEMYPCTSEEGQAILNKLYEIFAGTNPDISYDNPTAVQGASGVMQRVIRFSVTIPTSDPEKAYMRCKTILEGLTTTGRRSLLDQLTITPVNGDLENDDLRLSGIITFYERAV